MSFGALGFLHFEDWNWNIYIFELRIMFSNEMRALFVVIVSSIQGLICSFSNRRQKASMCHYKEIENRYKKHYSNCWGTEPLFRANLLFGYAQSDYERTSFSGSTVSHADRWWMGLSRTNQYNMIGATPYIVIIILLHHATVLYSALS